MKKFIAITILLISSIVKAQQEIKIDLLDALALKTLEVSYEYYTSEQSSVGLSVLFNFEKKTADFRYNEDQMITPYFRHYFSNNNTWNYFGEIFMGINIGRTKSGVKYTDIASGIAVGSKYISNGGFIVDVYSGLGRNMFSADSPPITPRVGINIGYRF